MTIGNSGTGALNGYLYISGKNPYEPGGNGTLHITNGGMVNSKAGLINYNLSDFESIGKVIVDGTGSIWNTDYFLLCGYSYTRTGMLSIANDGSVNVDGNASIFGINNCALLSIEISNNDMFTVSGNFTNNGLVRLSAEAGLSAGEYTPISVTGSWLGSGSYEVFGGVWDSTAHTFTVAAAQQTQAGQQTTINLQTTQRIEVGNTLEVNFAATQSSNPLNFTASVTGDAVLDALAALLSEGESVQGSWDFSISGLPVQSNVLLSFAVTGFDSADDLNVWYYDSVIGWVKSNANDLVLSDGWASFTVSRFSSYAITSVPEPATLSLLLISSIALLRRSSIQFTI